MLKNKTISPSNKLGFTIVEMLIIAPIVILVIGAFVTAIVNMTGEVMATRGSNVLAYSIQDSLNQIEKDIKYSTTFLAKNNVPLISPQGYNDTTSGFTNVGANGPMLILNTLVTVDNPLTQTGNIVYLKDSPNACGSTAVSQNNPMTMNVIYFIKNNTLWRRSVMPENYLTTGCTATPWQQPSCAFSKPLTGFCKTHDMRLIDGIDASDFVVQYFNAANETAANAVATSESASDADRYAAMQAATTIGVTIDISKTAAGRAISQAGTIRATKLDINASTIAPIVPDVVPAAPSGLSAKLDSPGRITVSWYPNATSYTLQYDTTNSFSSPTTINSITTPNKTVSGLLSSAIYYFRVSATNSAGTSPYSSSVNQWSTIVNGIAGWWRLNGNANDSAGNNNGTVSGATLTTGQNGQANSAYSFNGVSNYISCGNFGTFYHQGTISFWMKADVVENYRNPFTTNYNGANNGIRFEEYTTSTPYGGFSAAIGDASSAAGQSYLPSTALSPNTWYHVALVWNKDTNNIIGYLNNVLKFNASQAVWPTTIPSVAIGSGFDSSRFWKGSIDDARIYSRVLSASEISSLYSVGAQ